MPAWTDRPDAAAAAGSVAPPPLSSGQPALICEAIRWRGVEYDERSAAAQFRREMEQTFA